MRTEACEGAEVNSGVLVGLSRSIFLHLFFPPCLWNGNIGLFPYKPCLRWNWILSLRWNRICKTIPSQFPSWTVVTVTSDHTKCSSLSTFYLSSQQYVCNFSWFIFISLQQTRSLVKWEKERSAHTHSPAGSAAVCRVTQTQGGLCGSYQKAIELLGMLVLPFDSLWDRNLNFRSLCGQRGSWG